MTGAPEPKPAIEERARRLALSEARAGGISAEAIARAHAADLRLVDSATVRRELAERGAVPAAEGILEALTYCQPCPVCGQRGFQRWAFRLYAKLAGWIRPGRDAVRVFLQGLSVLDEAEARRLISVAQRASTTTEEGTDATAAEWLRSRGWTVTPPPSTS